MISMMLVLAAAAGAPAQDFPVGQWKTESRNGVVEIAKCGTSICGKLVSSDGIRANPNLTDDKNANASLRTRPLKGIPILWGFKFDGSRWSSGKIYKADEGKTYNAEVLAVDANTIKVSGCIFKPLCKTQTWRRVR